MSNKEFNQCISKASPVNVIAMSFAPRDIHEVQISDIFLKDYIAVNPTKYAMEIIHLSTEQNLISILDTGYVLIATKKLGEVRSFEGIVALLGFGTRHKRGHLELSLIDLFTKKIKQVKPTNLDQTTTFVDRSMHFSGSLESR